MIRTVSYTSKGKRRVVRLYSVWSSMRQRCLCVTNSKYKDYGGRGINICLDWESFGIFRTWALNTGYKKGLTLERVDNDGNYEPSNCKWATMAEQNHNSRQTKLTMAQADAIRQDDRNLEEIAKEYDVAVSKISRIKHNKSWRRKQ